MLKREVIVERFEKRMSEVSGVSFVARNPIKEPQTSDLPCIQFFELGDGVDSGKVSKRGAGTYPSYIRTLSLIAEIFIAGSSEEASSKELLAFVEEVKKKFYEGGNNLGLSGVELVERGAGRVLRPPAGDNIAGMGIELEIAYIEDTSEMF